MSEQNILFSVSQAGAKKKQITKLERIIYAIDTSGSTSGQILRDERESAKMFFLLLSGAKENSQIFEWNSMATRLASLDQLTSAKGGTCPSCIVDFLALYKPELLVLYTDGEVDRNEGDVLSQRLVAMKLAIPIIIVFTLKSALCTPERTVKDMETMQINMSIPEGVMKVSSDVCIIVNANGVHHLLMASGAFREIFVPMGLENTTKINQLPRFDFSDIGQVSIFEATSTPAGCIRLAGFEHPLILERFYTAQPAQITVELINAISDRVVLPRLDLDRVHQLCVRMLSANDYENDPEYKEAMQNLMRVAVACNKTLQHVACRERVDAIRARLKASTAQFRAQRTALQSLLQMIANYRANQNQFVLGSNRANRATVLSNVDPNQLRETLTAPAANILTIEDCPIFMEAGNACVLLTCPLYDSPPAAPKKSITEIDAELVSRFTSDYSINSPFQLGVSLIRFTPRIFSAQMGLECMENPFTREKVCARVVLVRDVHSLMRQLCRSFCASRQMWHVVMAFASALAKHLLEDKWAEHSILLPYFLWLTKEIRTTIDFSDDSLLTVEQAQAKRVPLIDAIQNTMANYTVIMRNRLPSDSRAMMDVQRAVTNFTTDERAVGVLVQTIKKISGFLDVIETFSRLLDAYKKGVNPIDFIMERDEIYEHCVKPRQGLSAIIGMILFLDALQCNQNSRRGPKKYMNLALQDAIDLALREAKNSADPKVSTFYRAFTGVNVDDVVPLHLPEPPKNLHFGAENFERSATINGKHYSVCGYCGFKRACSQVFRSNDVADQQAHSDMREHFLRSFTPEFFYNGYRYTSESIAELGVAAPEEKIFILTKNKLYAKHGVNFWALHTLDCKNQMLYFIRLRKFEAGLLAEKPIKID